MNAELSQHIRVVWAAVVICVAAIVLAGTSVVYSVITNRGTAERADEFARSTHDALCTFKTDLRVRVENTERFLDEIESGVRPPIPGISNGDIQRSIDNQRATLRSLASLECD